MDHQLQPSLKPCRLCREFAPLQSSHIIPRFFNEGASHNLPTGKQGAMQPFLQPVHVSPNVRFPRRQKGYWEKHFGLQEHLLCSSCERRLNSFETYSKRFLYGNSKPIRLQLPMSDDPFFIADYSKFKLFQLSLLWRASEAKGSFFKQVNLGPLHSERIRQMLLSGNPGRDDEYPCGLARLYAPEQFDNLRLLKGSSLEDIMMEPIKTRLENSHIYRFMMGAISWVFCVTGGKIPELFNHTYIKETGMFFLSPYDARSFLNEFSMKVFLAGNMPDWESTD